MSTRKAPSHRTVPFALIKLFTLLTMAVIAFPGLGCGTDPPGGPDAKVDQAGDRLQRDDVFAFWKVYREATRLRLSGNHREALRAYQQALAYDSTHEDALYYTGNVAREIDLPAIAASTWTALTRINPSSSRAFLQLGTLHLCDPESDLFDLRKAETNFREAVRLNREETGGLLRLGQFHLVNGASDSAAVYFDAVLGSNPSSGDAVLLKAFMDWKKGDRSSVERTVAMVGSMSDGEAPEGMSSEGDTRSGAQPMLSPGTGCELFGPFEGGITTRNLNAETLSEMFTVLSEQLSTIPRRSP